jgi:hypothetical protein
VRFGAWALLFSGSAAYVALSPDDPFPFALLPVIVANLLAVPPGDLRRRATRTEWLTLIGLFLLLAVVLTAGVLVPIPALWYRPSGLAALLLRWAFAIGLLLILFVETRRFVRRRRERAASEVRSLHG